MSQRGTPVPATTSHRSTPVADSAGRRTPHGNKSGAATPTPATPSSRQGGGVGGGGYSARHSANNTPSQISNQQPSRSQSRLTTQQQQQQQQNNAALCSHLEEQIYTERMQRDSIETSLILMEERSHAERLEADEEHQRRLLEMFLVTGMLKEDRHGEGTRELEAAKTAGSPAVAEQLAVVGQHLNVERSVVDALRRQLEARMSAHRATAAKEREKTGFYRTMLIRRMRQLEDHVRMLCGANHWLLQLPDLAHNHSPHTTVSGLHLQASPAVREYEGLHARSDQKASNIYTPSPAAKFLSTSEADSAVQFAKMLSTSVAGASPQPAADAGAHPSIGMSQNSSNHRVAVSGGGGDPSGAAQAEHATPL